MFSRLQLDKSQHIEEVCTVVNNSPNTMPLTKYRQKRSSEARFMPFGEKKLQIKVFNKYVLLMWNEFTIHTVSKSCGKNENYVNLTL